MMFLKYVFWIFLLNLMCHGLEFVDRISLSDDINYAMLTPSTILAGTSNRFCFSRLGNAVLGNCTVETELIAIEHKELSDKNEVHYLKKPTVKARNNFKEGNGGCFAVYVPKGSFPKVMVYFKLRFQRLQDQTISTSRLLNVQHNSIIAVIQTDKQLYRAGETVMFRVIMLKYDLTPSNINVHSLHIEAPGEIFGSNVKLIQWDNLTTQYGLLQLSYVLDKYTVKGDWRIVLEDEYGVKLATESFTVTDYSLPKFNLIVDHPKTVFIGEKEIKFYICARYLYGEPVYGLIKTHLKTDAQYMDSIANMATTIKGVNKCLNYTVKTNLLGFNNKIIDGPRTIIAEIDFQERNSMSWKNRTVTIQVLYEIINIEFISKNKKHISPGLPYKVKVRLTDWRDTPIKFALVKMCRQTVNSLSDSQTDNSTIGICNSIRSDGKGIAQYTFTLSNVYDAKYLVLKATVLDYNLNRLGVREETKEHPSSSMHLTILHTSNVQLDIGAFNSVYELGARQSVNVFINFGNTEIIKTVTLHIAIISKGGAISGWATVTQCPMYINETSLRNRANTICYRKSLIKTYKVIIPIKILHQYCIDTDLLVYMYYDGEFVAARKRFTVKQCSYNKVHQKWLPNTVAPSKEAKLQINTLGPAICATSMKNVALNDLTIAESIDNKVVESLKTFVRRRNNFTGDLDMDDICSNDDNLNNKHIWYAFKSSGISLVTNLIPEYKLCQSNNNKPHQLIREKYDSDRFYFPETWLYELHMTTNGTIELNKMAPHDITTYESNTFCLNRMGLSVANHEILKVFQPFFVDIMIPDKVKRGEDTQIKFSVFNYMNWPVTVSIQITTEEKSQIKLIVPQTGTEYNHKLACVHSNDSYNEYLIMRANMLGVHTIVIKVYVEDEYMNYCGGDINDLSELDIKSDTMRRSFTVIPEGHTIRKYKSKLLCIDGVSEFKWESQSVDPVDGSDKWIVNVVGEITGPIVVHVNNLINLPMGCGEQNLALLAYNVIALEYMKSDGGYTEADINVVRNNIIIGIQRQQRYRHPEGGYSAFGPNDIEPSTWLTALTLKYLHRAYQLMEWNQNELVNESNWLIGMHMENGCFRHVGQVFHKEFKGGLSEEVSHVSLTAYVILTLMETQDDLKPTLLRDTQFCLNLLKSKMENFIKSSNDNTKHKTKYSETDLIYPYTLTTYSQLKMAKYIQQIKQNSLKNSPLNYIDSKVFATLDNGTEYNVKLLKLLAKRDGDFIWWEADTLPNSIETTSYAILILLELGDEENINEAMSAIKWISQYRNQNGGFISTQDTLIAMEALTTLTRSIPKISPHMTLTISTLKKGRHIQINEENKQLVHSVDVDGASYVKLRANGSGCIYVQATQEYNTLKQFTNVENPFLLQYKLSTDGVFECKQKIAMCKCAATLEICVSWTSENDFPDMAILEVNMPTGYKTDIALEYALMKQNNTLLRRIDENLEATTIIFYLSALNKTKRPYECYNLYLVGNKMKTLPAYISLYHYYQPTLRVDKQYVIPEKCHLPRGRSYKDPQTSLNYETIDNASHINDKNGGNIDETSLIANLTENEVNFDLYNQTTENLDLFKILCKDTKTNCSQNIAPQKFENIDIIRFNQDYLTEKINSSTTEVPFKTSEDTETLDQFKDFHIIDSSTDLAVPDGLEGTEPKYVQPPEGFIGSRESYYVPQYAEISSDERFQNWTNVEIDLEFPQGLEMNREEWVKPPGA